jgi:hypothetical protein
MSALGMIGGEAFWITGVTGGGKTTIARLLTREIADPFCVEEIDAQDIGLEWCREVERRMQTRSLDTPSGKNGWAFIINESHKLSSKTVTRLNTMLEPRGGIPAHVVFVFTTTIEGDALLIEGCDDAKPLITRCTRLPLAIRGNNRARAEAAKRNMESVGMDGHDPVWYENQFKAGRGSWRFVYDAAKRAALGSEAAA